MRKLCALAILFVWSTLPLEAATFVQAATPTSVDASGTGSFNLPFVSPTTAGSLIVISVSWEGADTTVSIATDGGLTAGPKVIHANGDMNTQWFYKLASAGSISNYAVSWSAARPFRKALGFEFSYSGTAATTGTATMATGTVDDDQTMSSGNITVSGTDIVVVGTRGAYSSTHDADTQQINGVTADGTSNISISWWLWYRLVNTGFTGAATLINREGNTIPHNTGVIGFAITAGGSAPPTLGLLGVGR